MACAILGFYAVSCSEGNESLQDDDIENPSDNNGEKPSDEENNKPSGNDNPSGGNSSSNQEDNLPDEARIFVGFWTGKDNPEMYFTADGRCFVTIWGDYSGTGRTEFGFWTYDKDTKILATTIAPYQFQITISNEQSWAGILYTGDKTYNRAYNKSSNLNLLKSMLYSDTRWETLESNGYRPQCFYDEDYNSEDFTFIYKYQSNDKLTGVVALENVESLIDMTLVFKSGPHIGVYRLNRDYFN